MTIVEELAKAVAARDYVTGRTIVSILTNQQDQIDAAKTSLAHLYLAGGDQQRRYIVNGVLEHLFESEAIERRFLDWQNDIDLQNPFAEAHAWADVLRTKRAFLLEIARYCVEEMIRAGFRNPRVMKPEIGVDSSQIEWDHEGETASLILDCRPDLAGSAREDMAVKLLMAKYAADPRHWTPDEYAPWQQWVHLHRDSLST
jgi:hypothetical protein